MPIEPETANQPMEMASHEIAETVRAAAALAEAAHTCATAGSRDEALRILRDIEPKLHEASQLLEVASFASRNVKGKHRA